jgi:imidazolonepropionase-like amidohydrolase
VEAKKVVDVSGLYVTPGLVDIHVHVADSEACRSAFRTDVDHDSEVMPISVPN